MIMKKKYFEQPELMVVHVINNDILTISIPVDSSDESVSDDSGIVGAAGHRGIFDSWDAGY